MTASQITLEESHNMKANPGTPLGVRVSPGLKEALTQQAAAERRSLRMIVETILERAVGPQPTQQGEAR